MITTAAVLFAILLPQSDVKEIKGRTLDGDGQPVAGVPVAAFWTVANDAWTPGGALLATSDDKGAFAQKVLWSGQPTAWFALAKDGTRGAIVVVDDSSVDGTQEFVLAPLATVDATFDFNACGASVPLLVSLMARPARTFVGQLQQTGEKLHLRLPPGEYALRTFSRDAVQFDRSFTVPAAKDRVDLGVLPIEPSVIARSYGVEPPPLGVTDARGVGKDFKLSDLKGKWVLLDFWGHW
ncbi:MAG TPA: hypothetical protein VF384_20465 [Planctomycetota bacterium]